MQTIQDAFMADIVANPEDDTPRLIYADWLQDHGGEDGVARAEFIRAQVELAKLQMCVRCQAVLSGKWVANGPCCCSQRLKDLTHLERSILGENVSTSGDCVHPRFHAWLDAWNVPRWFTRVSGFCDGPPYSFRRGFIAEVHAPLEHLLEHLPRLVQEHPITRAVAADKEPSEQPEGMITVWTWWNHHGRECGLPDSLWDLLDARPNKEYQHAKDYPTAEAAQDALSRALLALARRS